MMIPKSKSIMVINFNAWDEFLLQNLVEETCIYDALEINEEILEREVGKYDAVLFQIDLSNHEDFPFSGNLTMGDFHKFGKIILNEGIFDNTKRRLHSLLTSCGISPAKAEPNGDPEEVLILKSNRNWGGEHESNLPAELKARMSLDLSEQKIVGHKSYYLQKRKEVSEELWTDESIVIERYITNNENQFFRLYCCGDSFLLVVAHDSRLVKKVSGNHNDYNLFYTRDNLFDPENGLPEQIQPMIFRFLATANVDYCALDIVFNEAGEHYIIDMNLTPTAGPLKIEDDILSFLRLGINRRVLQRQQDRRFA